MQEQNFEKQVQQKMEEFSLTPSVPVWQKVEQEIQQKKRRRRVIVFWLFPFLLLGSGLLLWQALPTTILETAGASSPDPQELPNAPVPKESRTNGTVENQKVLPNTVSIDNPSIQKRVTDPNGYYQPAARAMVKTTVAKAEVPKNKQTTFSSTETNEPSVNVAEVAAVKGTKFPTNTSKELDGTDKSNPLPNTAIAITGDGLTNSQLLTDSLNNNRASTPQKPELTASLPKPETQESKEVALKPDSITVQKEKKKEIKWSFAVQTGIGISSIQSNLLAEVSNTPQVRSDFSLSNGTPTNQAGAMQAPSAVERAIGYQIAFLAKRSISRKLNAIIGLQYSQFTTTNQIGRNIARDTIISIAGSNKAIDGYYQTGPNSALQNYKNRYHFLELPLAIEWQPIRKTPLRFQAGTHLSYLIASNALVYDERAKIYYHNRDLFNKLQVHINSGLTYQVWKKKQWSLQAGPYFQYGITNLQKDDVSNNYHLFATGIKTQFSF